MDIVCKKCKAHNSFGAIFCRECGAKLDLEGIAPKKIKASGPKKHVNIDVLRIILAALFLAVLAAAVLAFYPVDYPANLPEAKSQAQREAVKWQKTLEKIKKDEKLPQIIISQDVAGLLFTAGLSDEFKLSEDYKVDFVPRAAVEFSGRRIEIALVTEFYNVPLKFKMSFIAIPDEKKQEKWVIEGGFFGRLPLPEKVCVKLGEKFMSSLIKDSTALFIISEHPDFSINDKKQLVLDFKLPPK